MSKESGYYYQRAWFDFSFENADHVTPTHTAMYLWFVELNNRMGWSEKFASPASQTLSAIGLKSYNTYKKVFSDLVSFGFVRLISESRNQYTACIIALSKFDKANNGSLDKSIILPYQNLTKHCEGTGGGTVQSTGSIIKLLNKETLYNFSSFWDLYAKKKDTDKCEKKWGLIKETERELIMKVLPSYISKTPDKKFRKNPLTWLNGNCWKDEIQEENIFNNTPKTEYSQW